MDLVQHNESKETFFRKMEFAKAEIHSLSTLLAEKLSPEGRPYLLYHHISAIRQRCNELEEVGRRLYEDRAELFKSDLAVQLLRQDETRNQEIPSPAFRQILDAGSKLNNRISLDFQTLLIFTGIALDELAHVAGYVLNVANPIKSSFDKVAKDDGTGEYAPLWRAHREAILWLDAIPRLYRNKMVVHRENP